LELELPEKLVRLCFTRRRQGGADFPTPLQKATAVKPWMNAIILSRKRETGKATPVKVWRFTDIISGLIEKLNRFYPNKEKRASFSLYMEADT